MWVSCDLPYHHRLQTAVESLNFQGWPVFDERFAQLIDNESNHFLQDPAGNASPTTCIVACIVAILISADFKEPSGSETACISTASDVENAFAMLKKAK